MVFTDQQKAQFVLKFLDEGRDYKSFERRIRREQGRRTQIPPHKTLKNWIVKFGQTGSLEDRRGLNHPRPVRTEGNIELVRQHFDVHPYDSVRRSGLNISKSSVHRILREDLHWHPYRIQTLQTLTNENHAARVAFCRDMILLLNNDPELLQNLVFTDECNVYANGEINSQTFRLWSPENPHWFAEHELHPIKVIVWLGFGAHGIVGPFFWNNRRFGGNGINAQWYEDHLERRVIPALRNWPNFNGLFFQHDGAPPHWALSVRTLLNREFGQRWIGRRPAPIVWPPYSPDLAPMDFWFFGDMKRRLFARNFRPRTRHEICVAIREVVVEMNGDPVVRQRVLAEFVRRLHECIHRGGQSVERR
jgi:hypothetical protein